MLQCYNAFTTHAQLIHGRLTAFTLRQSRWRKRRRYRTRGETESNLPQSIRNILLKASLICFSSPCADCGRVACASSQQCLWEFSRMPRLPPKFTSWLVEMATCATGLPSFDRPGLVVGARHWSSCIEVLVSIQKNLTLSDACADSSWAGSYGARYDAACHHRTRPREVPQQSNASLCWNWWCLHRVWCSRLHALLAFPCVLPAGSAEACIKVLENSVRILEK